jgi:hypothetical protein
VIAGVSLLGPSLPGEPQNAASAGDRRVAGFLGGLMVRVRSTEQDLWMGRGLDASARRVEHRAPVAWPSSEGERAIRGLRRQR